jgi:hypothetical protein
MLGTMPPPKKKPGEGKKLKNPDILFIRMDLATQAALAAFIADQEVPPERPAVGLIALQKFLAERGYLKLPDKS